MNYEERKPLLQKVQELRDGRTLVCFFNFDRRSDPPIAGLTTQFHADVKEALFRVLKESASPKGIDLCLYTRGGDTNSVWPIVTLLREFDPDFEVLIPFRCHSSGTLLALGARRIWMGPISELSPIDPSTGNQFNPPDPANPQARLAISVEDVSAYREFLTKQFFGPSGDNVPSEKLVPILQQFLDALVQKVHPLALGNVQRVVLQIDQLARNILQLHSVPGENVSGIVESLTTKFFSHLHMISRGEGKEILGERVQLASVELADALDNLLCSYAEAFGLRHGFFLHTFLGDEQEKPARFIGGVVESTSWSYLYETKATVSQHIKLPPNVQVQLPAGQRLPLVPGLPREIQLQVNSQSWIRNTKPQGVTL